jgi:ATP-dependent DNA helicase RecQ
MRRPTEYHAIGASLSCTREAIGGASGAHEPTIGSAVRYLCNVALRELSNASPQYSLSDVESTVVQVAMGLLQRGRPTLSSPSIERSLVNSIELEAGVSIEETKEKAIDFKTRFTGLTPKEWQSLIKRAHLPLDPRAQPDSALTDPDGSWMQGEDSRDSAQEHIFFTKIAPGVLGTAAAFLEPQRPFGTMVKAGTSDRRVDFALESPGGSQIVIEIDGEQHKDNPQKDIDRQRDADLHTASWNVVRFPTALFAEQHAETAFSHLAQLVKSDKYLTSYVRQSKMPIEKTAEGRTALRLVLTPHAVARVQLALLTALGRGFLRMGASVWRIAVIERDVACTKLAILDLIDTLRHLCTLYSVPFFPRVHLQIFRSHLYQQTEPDVSPFSELRDHLTIDTTTDWCEGAKIAACDVLLDIGVLAHHTLTYHDDAQVQRAVQNAGWAATLRTAHRSTPRELVHWRAPRPIQDAKAEDITYFLQLVFRKCELLPGQLEVIGRALRRQSVLGLLPTGAGKSATYQLSTLLSPGFAIVIDPLKSLMQDQVDNLARAGIDATIEFHSDLSDEQKAANIEELGHGDARFVFIAPERLQIQSFRDQLRGQCGFKPVSFVVIDEAHCVSEWGHDFRPSYLNVGRLARTLCQFRGKEPSIIALTGTASRVVLTDVQREIGINDPEAVIMPKTLDRKKLHFLIERVPSREKELELTALLKRLQSTWNLSSVDFFDKERGGLVFARYVNGEFGAVQVAQILTRQFSEETDRFPFYVGSPPRGYNGDRRAFAEMKMRVQRDFKNNEFPILVATSAFGMGIDKPNIRYTIHFGIPPSLEAFYQEAGRAGRDDQDAICAVIFSDDDKSAADEFLDTNRSAEEAHRRYKRVARSQQGDASRNMYFLANTFKGEAIEFENVRALYRDHIQSSWRTEEIRVGDEYHLTIPFQERGGTNDEKTDVERAVYRLLLLGLFDDYTVDFANQRFHVIGLRLSPEEVEKRLYAYVLRYTSRDWAASLRYHLEHSPLDDPIERCIEALTWFVYEEIEKKRRAALGNIVSVMRNNDGAGFRQALLAYLEETELTKGLYDLVKRTEPEDWWSLFTKVISPLDANQLLGQCRRALESYPGDPGLHALRGLSQAMLSFNDPAEIVNDLRSCIGSLMNIYHWDAEQVAPVRARLLAILSDRVPDKVDQIVAGILRTTDEESDEWKRAAYPFVIDPIVRRSCAIPILRAIRTNLAALSEELLEV